jgi:hypothetical protein
MDAPLELLHILDRQARGGQRRDHSGAIGVNAQETLLTELSEEDEARSKAMREEGRLFLNRLRERAIAAGVEAPDVRQRYGDLERPWWSRQDGCGCSCSAAAASPPRPRSATSAATSSAWCARCSGRSSPSPTSFTEPSA